MSVSNSIRLGFRSSLGYFLSTFLFGIMFGIAAVNAGLENWLALFMSGAVFSASAQFASLEFWQQPLPLTTIALSVFLISTRNLLLGMAMTHHFDNHSTKRKLIWLFLLNDPGVVTSVRLDKSVDRLGYITGYGLSLMLSWLTATQLGVWAADIFASTDLGSLEFAGPLVLTTMMMLFAKGSKLSAAPWLISGLAALVLNEFNVADYIVLPLAVAIGVVIELLRTSRNARSA